MKLADNFKPHLIASKDEARHILQNVCMRHGMSMATDGKMMVAGINPEWTEELEPDEAIIPLAVCIAATKKRAKHLSLIQNTIEIKEDEFVVQRTLYEKTTFKSDKIEAKKYPSIIKVLPEHKNPITITFSAKLLKQLSDALGEEQINLTFDEDDPGACMIVTPSKLHDRFGLLMPTRFELKGELSPRPINQAIEKMRELSKKPKQLNNQYVGSFSLTKKLFTASSNYGNSTMESDETGHCSNSLKNH